MGQLKFDPRHDLSDIFLYHDINLFMCELSICSWVICYVVMVALFTVLAGENIRSVNVAPI